MPKTLILSDLHLGAANAQTEHQLAVLETDFDCLIVNGDTVDHFDFRQFSFGHHAVLQRLRGIGQERELILIRGNHDQRLPLPDATPNKVRLLEHILGVPMRDQWEVRVGRHHYLVLHGDQFDRTMNLTAVGEMADFVYRRVQRLSQGTARWLKAASKLVCGVVEQVKHQACEFAAAHRYQGVIVGHTHFPSNDHFAGVHYLNTGCWVEEPCSYVMIDDDIIELRQWGSPASAPEIILPAWRHEPSMSGV